MTDRKRNKRKGVEHGKFFLHKESSITVILNLLRKKTLCHELWRVSEAGFFFYINPGVKAVHVQSGFAPKQIFSFNFLVIFSSLLINIALLIQLKT